jgi:glucose/arabinose dehydrogenase
MKKVLRLSPRRAIRAAEAAFLAMTVSTMMFANDAWAQTYKSKAGVTFKVVEVANGLENPWALAFLPNGDMLVTEKPGRLRVIRSGKLEREPVEGAPRVNSRGQGGLLDVAPHPNFASNRLIYLSYAGEGEGGVNTEVMRARLNGNRLEDPQVIFRAMPKTGGGNHYGSRLLFAPDGTLYITLGDRFSLRDRAQNVSDHLGTVVRVKDDGGVPEDNPFRGKSEARPEIFSYGHRNSQGIALRPGTSEVWMHEHGPRGGDEVNLLKPGANYGWPKITYGVDYSGAIISDKTEMPGMEQPVVQWTPSIAPSGMAFYNGDKFPEWKGDLFVGALALTHLRRLKLDGARVSEQEQLLGELDERIRDVRSGPDGFLYLVTDDSRNGRVLRLEPAR